MKLFENLKGFLSSPKISPFVPKSVVCLMEGYSWKLFSHDLLAGITVGVIALPLAMAFAIASGLGPEKGIYTAVIAGFLNSLFGGSRFLIGGPTGAYVVLIFGIVQKYGYEGLVCATLEAATLLFLLGFFKCGTLIKFIPYPVIVGFTSGIAILLISSQINEFFGLHVPHATADFVDKMRLGFEHASTASLDAILIAVFSLLFILVAKKKSKKFPGVIVALILATLVTLIFNLPVETIFTKFGQIPSTLPTPSLPSLSFDLFRKTFPDAVGIALLGAIESLLCAVIADSLTGTRHKSNCELMAQGISNFGSIIFGGIPSTGAIARTTASLQFQAKTPLAGIIHALTLLLLMLVLAPYASLIPLAALAAVLVSVGINMFEFEEMKDLVKGFRGDALIMLATLAITVFVDLNAAVQTGVLLSIVLFLKKTTESTRGKIYHAIEEEEALGNGDLGGSWQMTLPPDTKVYEIEGPLFFGVSDMLSDVFRFLETLPKTLIIRMRSVPFIDSTGINALEHFVETCHAKKVNLYLCELNDDVLASLEKAEFFEHFPKERVIQSIEMAVTPPPFV